jgi:hypothetical protein
VQTPGWMRRATASLPSGAGSGTPGNGAAGDGAAGDGAAGDGAAGDGDAQGGPAPDGAAQGAAVQGSVVQGTAAQGAPAESADIQAADTQAADTQAADTGGGSTGGGNAQGGDTGAAGSRRTKIALLAAGGVGVLVVAGVTIGTLGAGSASRTTTVSDHDSSGAQAGTAAPLRVESVTQGGAVTGTNGASPIRVTLSAPLAGNSPMPALHPATPGSWAKAGSTLTFTPSTPFWPGSRVRVTIPAGGSGLRSAAGGVLAKTVTQRFTTQHWSTLRLKQMLAQLGYLPLKWAPQNPAAMQPDNIPTELSAMYSPPAGTFTWKRGYPSVLTSFWGGKSSLIMQGAIRAFQSNEGLTMTGVMTPALWRHVVRAAAAGKANPNGYSYALARKSSPETLTVWHNGHVILRTLANTGIPVAPTADGTFPVYLRFRFQIMQGTNPDGSHYSDPVSFVAYFNGGDAVHYFPRGFYGAPQSLGCVELPLAQAQHVWPFLTYGTLVTVR